MFAASVLKDIHDPELRELLHLDDTEHESAVAVNWIGDGIKNIKPSVEDRDPEAKANRVAEGVLPLHCKEWPQEDLPCEHAQTRTHSQIRVFQLH